MSEETKVEQGLTKLLHEMSSEGLAAVVKLIHDELVQREVSLEPTKE